MGNRAPEVQSKFAMGIIAFVDALVSPWDIDEKRSASVRCRIWGLVHDRAGMVRKNGCCIATVRVDDVPARAQIVNSLFQIRS
jgi:hypothetical protein